MSQYTTPQETASVFRKATPNELWLHEQLDRINPERHEMASAGDTQALTILAFELRRENVRLTGEAKVMRDLLTKARDVIEVVIKDGEMESDEGYQMAQLSDAMAKAVGMPLDVQFLPADDTEGGDFS